MFDVLDEMVKVPQGTKQNKTQLMFTVKVETMDKGAGVGVSIRRAGFTHSSIKTCIICSDLSPQIASEAAALMSQN